MRILFIILFVMCIALLDIVIMFGEAEWVLMMFVLVVITIFFMLDEWGEDK